MSETLAVTLASLFGGPLPMQSSLKKAILAAWPAKKGAGTLSPFVNRTCEAMSRVENYIVNQDILERLTFPLELSLDKIFPLELTQEKRDQIDAVREERGGAIIAASGEKVSNADTDVLAKAYAILIALDEMDEYFHSRKSNLT
jgi:hypothetical protein